MEPCLMIKLKTSGVIFCRFFVSSFEIFRFDSFAAFLESVNRNNQFLHGKFLDVIVLFLVFKMIIIVSMVAFVLKSSVVVLLVFSFIVPT